MYPIYSMDIALPVMKSRWEDASGKVPEYRDRPPPPCDAVFLLIDVRTSIPLLLPM